MPESGPQYPPGAVQNYPREYPAAPAKVGGRWMAPVALALSALAAAASVWALVKPAPAPPEPETPGLFAANPTAADPRAEACKGALLVAEGVARQSRTDLGPEQLALETVAANTRLAMAGGAAYLRDFTPANTPAELAEPIGALAKQLQEIALHFFVAETGDQPAQAERLKAASDTTSQLLGLCK